jgi:hypothetical protein
MMETMRELFTPAEANRTLPLVRRIVADILERGAQLRELAPRQEKPGAAGEMRDVEGRLREHLAELQRIGCYYKDWSFDKGLVDFPARIEGREVLLCWRTDEDHVTWFHPVEEGFAGRQPIPPELLEGA